MGILTSIALIICGLLAAASLIVKKQPNAKELIDKLVPYQGWIGLIVCILGIWTIIRALLHASLFSYLPVYWLMFLGTGVLEFILGFLLGFALITKYFLSGSPEAMAKGQQLRTRLAGWQIPLGIVAIVLGVWFLIENLMYLR
jgi:hypothetical protein